MLKNISAVMEMLFAFIYCGLNTLTLYQGDYCSFPCNFYQKYSNLGMFTSEEFLNLFMELE